MSIDSRPRLHQETPKPGKNITVMVLFYAPGRGWFDKCELLAFSPLDQFCFRSPTGRLILANRAVIMPNVCACGCLMRVTFRGWHVAVYMGRAQPGITKDQIRIARGRSFPAAAAMRRSHVVVPILRFPIWTRDHSSRGKPPIEICGLTVLRFRVLSRFFQKTLQAMHT